MIDSRQWCKTRDVLEQCLGAAAGRGERRQNPSVLLLMDLATPRRKARGHPFLRSVILRCLPDGQSCSCCPIPSSE